METVSASLALCVGNPLVTSGFPSQRASNTGFDVFFHVSLKKWLNKQSLCTCVTFSNHRMYYHRLCSVYGSTHVLADFQKDPQTSDISNTLLGNKIVDHSDVVGASPVGAAPTTSSFSTCHLASIDCTKTTARWDEKHLSLGIWYTLYKRFDYISLMA